MPQFTPSSKQLTDFNNGNRYINRVDSPSADDFNNVIESQLYVQGLAKNTPDTSEANNVGTPSVTVTTSSDGSARLKFSNLKGVGISNITSNGTDPIGNNLYTIYLTDGTSYSFTSPKGPQGIQGESSVTGIEAETSIEDNGYTVTPLTFQFEDGNTQTVNVKVKNGIDGADGITPNIQIGQVTTGAAGSQASATITGTTTNPLLNLTIPQGQQGIQGISGQDGQDGQDGAPGANGVTFTPNVDADGNISWTNDGNLPNPDTVNIRGPKGDPGQSTIVKTAAEWASDNTVLGAGVFGYDSTSKITKIGDGITAWANLPLFITSGINFATLSWHTINQLSQEGLADKYFSVGDEKTIELTTGEQVTLVILGFDHDDLTGGGKAGISIGMKNLLATTYRMNATATNVGGWDESEMRTSTMATLLSQLPSDLQSVIKQVNKKATAGDESTSITTSADKLWLLAEVEVDGTISAGYADEGEQYEYWKTVKDGTVIADRIKYLSNGSGSEYGWWLRSPSVSFSTNFRIFTAIGRVYDKGAGSASGVSFGFCV